MRMIFVALLVVTLLGCQRANHTDTAKTYDIEGKVTAVDAANSKVKLDHKDIPGFMKAMEMNFPVADAKLLDGLKVGDTVRGKLNVQGGAYRLTELKKD